MSPEDYLKQRVENQIEWFSRKSRQNNRAYLRLEVLAILFSVSIPFASLFMTPDNPWARYTVGFMGVAIALATGLLALMKYRDHWVEYRATTEMLKRERFMYLTGTGPYTAQDHFNLFVQRVEAILAQEVSNWKNYRIPDREEEK